MNLLDELWVEILLELPPKYICFVSLTSKYFYNLVKDNNLINKRKNKGFTRKSGCCKVFNIVKCDDEFTTDILLEGLYAMNADLIRGDILIINGDIHKGYIFDGIKFLNMINLTIPEEFIIFNNIPFEYYKPMSLINKAFNSSIWIDLNDVKDQCINNINSTIIHNWYILTTYFTHNNDDYIVVCLYHKTGIIDIFKNVLSKTHKLLFCYKTGRLISEIYNHIFNLPKTDNIIYLRMDYMMSVFRNKNI